MTAAVGAPAPANRPGDVLLEIHGLRIEGESDEVWHEIVKGVDLTLRRGEVLGLIGESGAGKSTIGLAALGYARPGCRIAAGSIMFDGVDLAKLDEAEKRKLWGRRVAYVAQSAAASFNPAHRLIDQFAETPTWHHVMGEEEARRNAIDLYRRLRLPDPEHIGGRYPHQVSGGQLQRAMTAMSMSCRFLRRTSLDEIPQLLNVVRGEMSVVGPRPHPIGMKTEEKLCHEIVAGYAQRHKMKPGITGWAQIRGWRGATDTSYQLRKRVEHDIHYVENWSLWLDIKILLMTAFKGFRGPNAF